MLNRQTLGATRQVFPSNRVVILTKYHGPGNVSPGRISADAGMKRRVIVQYDHALSQEGAHAKAAMALCERFGWKGDLIAGAMEKGFAFTFTFVPDEIAEAQRAERVLKHSHASARDALKRAVSSHWLSIDFDRNRTPEACEIRKEMCDALDLCTHVDEIVSKKG